MGGRANVSARQVEFPPLANGLDYLESVVEQLQGEPTSRNLKYAILHLVAGIEVVLKARLSLEHWSLVFEQPGGATTEAWRAGEFRSCSILQAFDRLGEIVGIEFPSDARHTIRALQEKRNRLQHFGLSDSAPAVQAVAIRALNFLLSFATEHLADELNDPVAAELLERIRRQLAGIDQLVTLRLKELAATLDGRDVVVTCPECTQLTLELGERCVCHFCGAAGEPETVARHYLYAVLGEDEYSAGKGRTGWSLDACPSCERETLVKGVVVRGHSPDREGLLWCCFAEGVTRRPGEMGECMNCGRAIELDDEGPDLCADCLEAALERF
jgi:hypothetical protein